MNADGDLINIYLLHICTSQTLCDVDYFYSLCKMHKTNGKQWLETIRFERWFNFRGVFHFFKYRIVSNIYVLFFFALLMVKNCIRRGGIEPPAYGCLNFVSLQSTALPAELSTDNQTPHSNLLIVFRCAESILHLFWKFRCSELTVAHRGECWKR